MVVVVTTERHGRASVHVTGRFDAYEAPRVSEVVRHVLAATSPTTRVELDLSKVYFFDSHALRAVQRLEQDSSHQPTRFALVQRSSAVDTMYRLTGQGLSSSGTLAARR